MNLEPIFNIVKRKLNKAILTALGEGPLRYSKLHHAVSQTSSDAVHARTLTRTLIHLQEEGLVEHYQDTDTADYRLTAAGTELFDLLVALGVWKRQPRSEDPDEDDR